MRGKLVVIEGSDGSGKGTQVDLLTKFLKSNNITHNLIGFPRYKENMYGSFIRKYLDGAFGDPVKISPYLGSLAYAMDRLLAKPLIESWLKQVKLVIADRYAYSNMAFGAAKLTSEKRSAFIKWVAKLEFKENNIPQADLVLYLNVPVAFSQRLMASRKKDGHESNVTYQEDVEKEYLKLAKKKNWVTISCVKNGQLLSKLEIHRLILLALKKKGFLSKESP